MDNRSDGCRGGARRQARDPRHSHRQRRRSSRNQRHLCRGRQGSGSACRSASELITSMLVLLAVLALGLSAGALVAEGAVLVPFWRSLQPESFLAWYRQHAMLLLRFFGPLEIVAASLAVVAALVSWLGDEPASGLLAISAVLAVLVLAMFPLYFQRANASFVGATIATTEVGVELRRWSIWHWVRVVLAIAAFAVAVVAARKA